MSNLKELVEKNQELVDLILKLEKENNELKNSLESKKNKEETKINRALYEKIIGDRNKNEKYFTIDMDFKIQVYFEYLDNYDDNQYNSFNYFKNKEEAEKHARHEFLSLKLIRLRNKLNDGWKPDWNDNLEQKYFIVLELNKIRKPYYSTFIANNLYFKTQELRSEFLKLIPLEEILEYLNF